jgi:hypothetical protein
MWIFTRYGMFSVVCGRDFAKSKTLEQQASAPLDLNMMMIRARNADHLRNLISAFPGQLKSQIVRESRGNDYRYRLVIPRKVWLDLAASLVDDIDYGNFKGVCHQESDAGYVSALHRVWQVGYDYQRDLAFAEANAGPDWDFEEIGNERAGSEQARLPGFPETRDARRGRDSGRGNGRKRGNGRQS